MEVQIFGTRKSAETRKALRFFAERRIKTHFVDLKERPASKGELTRFAQRFGPEALVDRDGPRYRDLGLHVAQPTGPRWIEKLVDEPMLLRQPLVRCGKHVSVGVDEAEWKRWIDQD